MRSKFWCWTWNNPSVTGEQLKAALETWEDHVYSVFQKEIGVQGTPHFQGYTEFSKRKIFTNVTRMHPQFFWQQRKGTQKQARDYCMKSGRIEDYVEVGTFTECVPGQRSDLNEVVEKVKLGKRHRDLLEDHGATMSRYPKGIQWISSLAIKPRDKEHPPEVDLYYGPPDCGKSRKVHDNNDDLFCNPIGQGGWYDGYEGHEQAIFEDFAGKASHTSLVDFLRVLDRYPVQVPVKGGFVQWRPTHIFVTTNVHPSKWWDYTDRRPQYRALQRRFTRVLEWGRDGRIRTWFRGEAGWEDYWEYSDPEERYE